MGPVMPPLSGQGSLKATPNRVANLLLFSGGLMERAPWPGQPIDHSTKSGRTANRAPWPDECALGCAGGCLLVCCHKQEHVCQDLRAGCCNPHPLLHSSLIPVFQSSLGSPLDKTPVGLSGSILLQSLGSCSIHCTLFFFF